MKEYLASCGRLKKVSSRLKAAGVRMGDRQLDPVGGDPGWE